MKRTFDLVVSSLLLLVFSPLLVGIAFIVWIVLGRPILFRQNRPGYQGQPFEIYKFRTMAPVSEPTGPGSDDEERLTRLGSMLRATSLDELPELWNVIKGDMSLVGPRPLLIEYLPLYSARQARRHDVRPGITGWAQVNGRNELSWEEKFELDVWYVDNWSFWLDLKILFLTIVKVVRRQGINEPGQATARPFRGVRS